HAFASWKRLGRAKESSPTCDSTRRVKKKLSRSDPKRVRAQPLSSERAACHAGPPHEKARYEQNGRQQTEQHPQHTNFETAEAAEMQLDQREQQLFAGTLGVVEVVVQPVDRRFERLRKGEVHRRGGPNEQQRE